MEEYLRAFWALLISQAKTFFPSQNIQKPNVKTKCAKIVGVCKLTSRKNK